MSRQFPIDAKDTLNVFNLLILIQHFRVEKHVLAWIGLPMQKKRHQENRTTELFKCLRIVGK